jgi:putative multiple sugar transport system ATP-binding protein
VIDWPDAFRAPRLLRKVGLPNRPDTLITNIGVGKQQLVEIAKALPRRSSC